MQDDADDDKMGKRQSGMVQVGVREERKVSRLLYICVIRNAVRGRTTSSCATVPIYYTTRPVLRQQAISGTRKSLHHHHYRQAGKARRRPRPQQGNLGKQTSRAGASPGRGLESGLAHPLTYRLPCVVPTYVGSLMEASRGGRPPVPASPPTGELTTAKSIHT